MSTLNIEMQPVTGSTNIEAVGWQGTGMGTGVLRIRFHSGHTWDYEGVTEQEAESLRLSPSPGKYFHSAIKGQYSGERVG